MTSFYARYRNLSQQTIGAYQLISRSIDYRLDFYLYYFQDVVPNGITVHHVASGPSNNPRQEIQLRTVSGRIFMSGLVSLERGHVDLVICAADEAYTHFDDGYFVQDDGAWRFFTAKGNLRMYCSFPGNDYELMGELDPVEDAREVAAWLQDQYDSLRTY